MTTQSPDVLQEAALSVTDWLNVARLAGDLGIRYRTNAALEQFVNALPPYLSATLPQQAATDEGEAYRRGIYDAKVWLRDQQHKNPPDSLWHAAAILADRMDVALLSTPTAQPPAAETRMRRVLAAIRDEGMQNHNTRCRKWWPDVLAALTQPEPTAQQGGDEGAMEAAFWHTPLGIDDTDEARKAVAAAIKFALSAQQGVMPEGFGPLSELVAQQGGEEGECCPHGYLFAETCPHCGGQIDDAENAVREIAAQAFIAGATAVHDDWTANPGPAPRGDPEFGESAGEYAQSIDLSDFSAQQAAGEAEAGGRAFGIANSHMLVIGATLESLTDRNRHVDRLARAIDAYAAQRVFEASATPQPTETQRIVAWLRAEIDATWGVRCLDPFTVERLADAIEAGEHLAGEPS